MNRLRIHLTHLAVVLVALLAAFPAAAQCDPDGREGTISDVLTGGSALEWRLLVEHREVTLTVAAPCGLVINRTYKEGESPSFSLSEIPAADPDGRYHWQLRVSPRLDSGLEKELRAVHESGDDGRGVEYQLRQKGLLPDGPTRQSGSFQVVRGSIVPPDLKEEGAGGKSTVGVRAASTSAGAGTCPAAPAVETARLSTILPAVDQGGSNRPVVAASEDRRRVTGEDVVFNDDLIVIGSACIGFDCVNGEVFGFDTIRMKENNLRIKFDDTSTVAGFPNADWQLTANDSASGGANKFSIEETSGGRIPFTVRGGAPTNSLFVDSGGRVGLRTSAPVLDLHVATGNTPGIRLEQTNTSGFTAQTWDIAGNEANFFVRDVTGGSRLPFRIRPGAPTSSIDVRANGNVGIGTTSASEKLHVTGSGGNTAVKIEETNGTAATRTLVNITNNGGSRIGFFNTSSGNNWQFSALANFNIDFSGNPGVEMQVGSNGNVTISGTLTTGGPTCGGGCDEVFSTDYPLESIEEHAEAMFANSYLPAVGPTQPKAPFNVTEKTGGILNELEKAHIYIAQLNDRVKQKDGQLDELTQQNRSLANRLARLEALLEQAVSQH